MPLRGKEFGMTAVDLRREGAVFVLTMQSGENRFNRPFLDVLNQALDTIEASSGPAALVTTGGTEKFYSNGLDLAWIAGEGQGEGAAFVGDVMRFLGRLMAFPVPTVAAVNGHAFAAGAMMALAHDFRVMRGDRGFLCLNEIDIRIPLAPGMTALVKSRLPAATLRDMVLTGMRLGGEEARARGIVDEAVAAPEVVPRAVARAAALADKDRATYGALKRGLYGEILAILAAGALGDFTAEQ
jgi:enoyl-CoA hydratase/carnithine racemase